MSTIYSTESADGTTIATGFNSQRTALREAARTANRTNETIYVVSNDDGDSVGVWPRTITYRDTLGERPVTDEEVEGYIESLKDRLEDDEACVWYSVEVDHDGDVIEQVAFLAHETDGFQRLQRHGEVAYTQC
jgi:hypothetical protein